jgi:hypothetical protein
VLELAKYDLNYDIRDKARLMRGVLFASSSPTLAQHAQRLFITTKPAPSNAGTEETKGSEYALGSLSHVVGHKALGYLVCSPTCLLHQTCVAHQGFPLCRQSPIFRLWRPTPIVPQKTPFTPRRTLRRLLVSNTLTSRRPIVTARGPPTLTRIPTLAPTLIRTAVRFGPVLLSLVSTQRSSYITCISRRPFSATIA